MEAKQLMSDEELRLRCIELAVKIQDIYSTYRSKSTPTQLAQITYEYVKHGKVSTKCFP